jgi:ribosomal protein S18 acetylase RimI-like enzyme
VIRQLQRDARASGVVLRLSVLRVNPALALYERLGFESLDESHGIVEMRSAE